MMDIFDHSLLSRLFLILALSFLSACAGDSGTPATDAGAITTNESNQTGDLPSSNVDPNLINGIWEMRSITIDPPIPNVGTDVYASMQECAKDDQFEFRPPGSYTSYAGKLNCNPGSPETIKGSYNLDLGSNTLAINNGMGTTNYALQSIEKDRFVLTYSQPVEGKPHQLTAVFERVGE